MVMAYIKRGENVICEEAENLKAMIISI